MAYSTPLTATANVALTAAQWNATVRDNLLETAPAKATTAGSIFVGVTANSIAERITGAATVGTLQTTLSTTYADLTTAGPAVTRTSGTQALVMWGCEISNGTTGSSAYMGFAVTGATSVAATDANALKFTATSGYPLQATRVTMQSVTSGSNVFTAKYRVDSGTGSFSQRSMVVIPF